MNSSQSTLIVFGGLPGTGKSSIARALAASLGALYLRIDTIEQAIRNAAAGHTTIHEEGYLVAYAVAADNLRIGTTVVADCVNAVQESRDAWREVGSLTNSLLLEVEVVCSDAAVHRQRVEARSSEIAGLQLPTWAEVVAREYHPWNRDHIIIDSAHSSVSSSVAALQAALLNRAAL